MDLTASSLGIGWRPQIALWIERRRDLRFVEIVAENIDHDHVPQPLEILRQRGVAIIPHGISLSLGGAERVERSRIQRLANLARRLGSPMVSEHIAFVRADGVEAGHLLPIPRSKIAIDTLVDNVKVAQDLLPVPLALENIAALFEWPATQMNEAEFLAEILDRTGASLLLDLANIWANAANHGGDPVQTLEQLPLHRVAYVHVAGGEMRDGVYHDTHAGPVCMEVLRLVQELCARREPPGVMLERDDHFPSDVQLSRELDAIVDAMGSGAKAREACHVV